MAVMAGYKQTEVGVIPEDWNVRQFGEIALPRRQRIDPRKSGIQEFCIELEHIGSATGSLLGSTSTGEQSSLKSVFRTSDVLFGKLRAYLRKYWQADRPGVCSTEIWVLSPIENLFSSAYLFQIVQTDKFIETASSSYGTHMPRSDWNVVKNYALPLPPTKAEQEAIAEALSDADALIESLEQLIAKKRHLKQGAMQQLLTGKKRLPGFSGEWEVSTFGDVFNITAGGDVDPKRTISYQDQTHCYPIYSNALTEFGLYGYCSYADHQAGSITVTARGTLGFANFRDHAYTAIGRVLVLQSKQKSDARFFAEVINNRIKFSIESTGVPQLTAPQISTYRLPVPSLPEQTAIATVLADMDAEIAALETRLAKTRELKQGMMHNLLTGKIRLV